MLKKLLFIMVIISFNSLFAKNEYSIISMQKEAKLGDSVIIKGKITGTSDFETYIITDKDKDSIEVQIPKVVWKQVNTAGIPVRRQNLVIEGSLEKNSDKIYVIAYRIFLE